MSNEQMCETCKFWSRHGRSSHGTCRRYPPFPDYTYLLNGKWAGNPDAMTDAVDAGFLQPITDEGVWCGEYQPREKGGEHESES